MNQITPYHSGSIGDMSQLPPHITYKQYKELKQNMEVLIGRAKNKKEERILIRDKLFITFLWETGGRVGDVVKIRYSDFVGRELRLYTKKRNKTISIMVSQNSLLIEDMLQYMKKYKIEDNALLFPFTKNHAHKQIKRYGKLISFPRKVKQWKNGRIVTSSLRPHLFRHGLAIYLLECGVNIPTISARLGHASPTITQALYMKITPYLQDQFINDKKVEW